MAMRAWDPTKKNEDLKLIRAEMNKRGLLGSNHSSKINSADTRLNNITNETTTEENEAINAINMMGRMTQVMESVSPIFEQIKLGTQNKDIPEGGVFDSYVRGYIFGFVNQLIESKSRGGIDANSSEAREIFGIMFGEPYSGGNEGVEFFNECLADRNAANNGSNSFFSKAFVSGCMDYQNFIAGRPVMQLSNYLANAL